MRRLAKTIIVAAICAAVLTRATPPTLTPQPQATVRHHDPTPEQDRKQLLRGQQRQRQRTENATASSTPPDTIETVTDAPKLPVEPSIPAPTSTPTSLPEPAPSTKDESTPEPVKPTTSQPVPEPPPDPKVERTKQLEAEARRLNVTIVWQDMNARGMFRPATPTTVYINPSILDDEDVEWAISTVRHEAAHSHIRAICARCDPDIAVARLEHVTDAYAHLFLGGLTRPRYGHDAADEQVARDIHHGACTFDDDLDAEPVS